MDNGEHGDVKNDGEGAVQVSPLSGESISYCTPKSVLLHEYNVPFFNSTTPGSCNPVFVFAAFSEQKLVASRHVYPSSSEMKKQVIPRKSSEYISFRLSPFNL